MTSTLGSTATLQLTTLLKLGLGPLFLSKKSINGSFDLLVVADSLRTRGPYCIENILCPSPRWGVGGTDEILNWGSQPCSRYVSVDVPWRGAIPARPDYLPRSLENARANGHRIRDNLF